MNSNAARLASRYRSEERGAIAIIAALLMPVLVGAMGIAIDYTFAVRDRAILQLVSDTTALAVARELAIARPNAAQVQSTAQGIALEELRRRNLSQGATVAATIQDDNTSIKVDVRRPQRAFFAAFTGGSPGLLGGSAVASLSGRRKICVVALDPSASAALEMKSSSWLTATGCDVFANSADQSAIKTEAGIRIESELICSSGGIAGSGDLRGERLTDCPPVSDPLANRPAPAEGLCLGAGLDLVDIGTSILSRFLLIPGTYCGGLRIRGKSFVRFLPGVYIIKGGEFRIDDDADVIGKHVGFYLSGEQATLKFKQKAKVWLDAPKDGPLAGLLFFEDRSVKLDRKHEISSNYVHNMTGTIYLPRGQLVVDATYDVAQQSAFTLIVVNKMQLNHSPRLVVNTDYGLTDVPIPIGLGAVNGPVRLMN